jgi:hypothetical protein
VLFAMTVNVEGGADVERLVCSHPLTRDVPAGWIDTVLLAAVCNYWWLSLNPEHPSMPGARVHQRAYADATLGWMRRRVTP